MSADGTIEQQKARTEGRFVFNIDRCHADIQTLKKLVTEEHWTIEYYATVPTLSILRPPEKKADGNATRHYPGAHDLMRLQGSNGRTQVWGCKLCHKFFNYPSLLFDDLFKNHNVRPDQAKVSGLIIKLEVENAELFRILKESRSA
jgi:hypothetical protein